MMHSLAEICLLTLGWGLASAEQGRRGFANRPIVNEDADWPISSGHRAEEGQGLSALNGLSQLVDSGRMV
eukprot:5629076-Pyramimonas_sp.AAC.1